MFEHTAPLGISWIIIREMPIHPRANTLRYTFVYESELKNELMRHNMPIATIKTLESCLCPHIIAESVFRHYFHVPATQKVFELVIKGDFINVKAVDKIMNNSSLCI